MSTFIGPEQMAPAAAIGTGSFYWQAPQVFLYKGTRFGFQLATGGGVGTWRIKAFRRDNAAKTWAEADAGNGPLVVRPGAGFGFATIAVGGYTMGSGVLNVNSVVGSPPFVGSFPFQVVLGNPVGPPGVLARLTVTGTNSPTQFAVTPISDANVAGGIGVYQTTSTPDANPLQTPNGCPTFIQDPADPTGATVICAYPEQSLSMLSFTLFDMSANAGLGAFGATVTGGPVVHGSDHVSSGKNYNDDTGAKACVAYRASDNKLLFAYQGALESVTGVTWIRAYFVTYDRTGAAWGASTAITGAGESLPFAAHGIVFDTKTGRPYCTVIIPTDGVGSAYSLYFVAVNADDSMNARVLMTSNVDPTQEPIISYPVLRPVGANVEIGCTFLGPFPNSRGFIVRGLVGLAPTFSTEQISTTDFDSPGDGSETATMGLGVGPDGNFYAFWFTGNEALDFFYRLWYSLNSGAGLGWPAPAQLFITPADDSTDFLDMGATVSPLPLIGLAIVGNNCFIAPSSPGVIGAAYFEFDVPTPPPILTLTFKGQKVYPQ
jgi:hypothetical protein